MILTLYHGLLNQQLIDSCLVYVDSYPINNEEEVGV